MRLLIARLVCGVTFASNLLESLNKKSGNTSLRLYALILPNRVVTVVFVKSR